MLTSLTHKLTIALLTITLLMLAHATSAYAMSCETLEQARQADPNDPRTQRVIALWQELYIPFLDLTGRSTALAVLHPDATATHPDGSTSPLKPTAHICPGAPPVVYVTWDLVEKTFGKKPAYPTSFLAFALGHELGHRINDLDSEGSLLGADERASVGTGYGIEELADKRAALFAASAGYPMSAMADAKIVSQFLATEHNLRPFRIESREQMLLGTLASFDAYENLYQIALSLLLSGEEALAMRLLERADELIQGQGVPLPEIKALRAIALMHHAAPFAPWRQSIASVGLPPLRCNPLYPSRTALSDVTQRGTLRSSDDLDARFAQAKTQLNLAKSLLDQAERYHLTPITLHSARACLATYEGDANAVKDALKLTEAAAGKAPPQPIRDTINQIRALATLTSFVAQRPAPQLSTGGGAKRWGADIAKLGSKVKGSEEAAQAVSILSHYPKFSETPPTPKPSVAIAACGTSPAPPLDLPAQPTLPKESALGQCPDGWRILHTLPPAQKTSSTLGVTTCAPGQADPAAAYRDRFVHLTLPGATSPPLDPVNMTLFMRIYAASETKRPSRESMTCGCQATFPRGVTSGGERAELLVCPARGLTSALLTSATDGLVMRITRYEEL